MGVYVRDINDNDPQLLNLPRNTSVSEGAAIHTSVARVQAWDADSGRNALLTYNITAGNQGGAFYVNDTVRDRMGKSHLDSLGSHVTHRPQRKPTSGLVRGFSVCQQTGVVQVNRPLDRERVAEYRLTITVKDNPENSRIARRVTSPPRVQLLQTFINFLLLQFKSPTIKAESITSFDRKELISTLD